jgi:hypothetical protein
MHAKWLGAADKQGGASSHHRFPTKVVMHLPKLTPPPPWAPPLSCSPRGMLYAKKLNPLPYMLQSSRDVNRLETDPPPLYPAVPAGCYTRRS